MIRKSSSTFFNFFPSGNHLLFSQKKPLDYKRIQSMETCTGSPGQNKDLAVILIMLTFFLVVVRCWKTGYLSRFKITLNWNVWIFEGVSWGTQSWLPEIDIGPKLVTDLCSPPVYKFKTRFVDLLFTARVKYVMYTKSFFRFLFNCPWYQH